MLLRHFFFSSEIQIKKNNGTIISDSTEIVKVENSNNIQIDLQSNENGLETQKVILKDHQTLRLLSLELFGNREFWVYIYNENKDLIPNPNFVTAGLELVIPEKSLYNIDPKDSESVEKAKLIGEKVLRDF